MIVCCSANHDVMEKWEAALNDTEVEFIFSLQSLIYHLKHNQNSIIFLHLALPGLHGINGAIELYRQFSKNRFCILVDELHEFEALTLLKLGIFGYAEVTLSPQLLKKAIHSIQEGELWYSRQWMQQVLQGLTHIHLSQANDNHSENLKKLSAREKQIASYIAKGASNKSIANQLNLTERTVKAHMTSILKKTQLHNRLEVALLMNSEIWCN